MPLSPVEKIKLSKRVIDLSKEIEAAKAAEKPNALAIMKLSKERVDLRKQLGAAVEKKQPESTGEFGFRKEDRVAAKKAREKINAQVSDIVDRIKAGVLDVKNLSASDIDLMKQYSGKGGLDDNSQDEYYTPPHIAGGVWDIMAENGFENGNILEPSTGNGVFSATKPKSTVISGAEISEVSATVNQALHPDDKITNEPFEEMVMRTEDNTFDGVVGNVPFGERGKEAAIDKTYRKERKLQSYFVQRVIDKVRYGGLITLVVPTGIISGKDYRKLRAAISLKAEFLGAHKLPSETFKNQGTPVVTDIIVMRKHSKEVTDQIGKVSTDTLREANVLWDEFISGKYWLGTGKRFIHGDFVPKDATDGFSREKVIAHPEQTPESLRKKLAMRFESHIDYDLLESAPTAITYYEEGFIKTINGMPKILTNGEWVDHVSDEDETGLNSDVYGASSLEELKALTQSVDGMLGITSAQAFKIYKKYPALLNDAQTNAVLFSLSQPKEKFREVAYRGSLLGSMVRKYAVGEDATDRDRVIRLLQNHNEQYGHPDTLKGLVADGKNAKDFGQFISSIDRKGGVSALVTGEAAKKALGFESDDIYSIISYLSRTGNDEIELSHIKKLYKGKRKLITYGDIADIQGIAIQPDGFVDVIREYLRGDAYEKVGELQTVISNSDDKRLNKHWQWLIDQLMSRVKRVEIEAVSFGLRDKWIDVKYKSEFFQQSGYPMDFILEDPDSDDDTEGYKEGVWRSSRTRSEFEKQLGYYMDGNSISHRIVGRGGRDASKEEKAAEKSERINEYQAKINDLEEQFRFFMQSHSDAIDIASKYNMTFNRHIEADYATDDLGIENLPENVDLHWYQNQGVRRLSEEGNGILGHDVGLGKTFQALAFSKYDRQLGRSKKHLIVVPNSVLGNWYNETKFLYGDHKGVMFVGFTPKINKKTKKIEQEMVTDEHGEPKLDANDQPVMQDVLAKEDRIQILEKMLQIPAMTSGVVIMTQENYKKIPLKPDTLEKHANEMIERSMMSDADAKNVAAGNAGFDKSQTSGKTYAQVQAEAKAEYNATVGIGEKGEAMPYFEDMGFDRVIVDEGHHYKSPYKSGLDRISYISNPKPSQRSQDMAIKMAHVQSENGGKGAILLTATPVSNSPIEIYNMLSYIMPRDEFEKFGIYTPDDFIRFFGEIDTIQKLTVGGDMVDRDGLKGFRNLNILRSLFARYADMKDAKDVDPEGNVLKLPPASEISADVEMNEEQHTEYEALRAEAVLASNPMNKGRALFAVIRDMERVTTDMDLFHKQHTFVFNEADEAKLSALIADTPESKKFEIKDYVGIDEDSTEEKQWITIVRPTEYTKENGKIIYVVPEEWELEVSERIEAFGIDFVSHPMTTKYQALIDNLKAEFTTNPKAKQIIFTEEKSQHGKLKRLLVASLPISEGKIGTINADTAGGEKLQEIADAFNNATHTIIIANKKAEVGVNLQKGTTAIHHMTLPWNPAALQQRNGRGVRQGNRAKYVNLFYYKSKGSFDEYRLDLLKNKSGWIDALLDKDSISDTHENENAMSDFEQQAVLSGNKEEFMAKIAEEQEKKALEKRQRQDDKAKSALSQLNSAKTYIKEFDTRKATALVELQREKELADKSLAAGIAENLGDEAGERTVARRTSRVTIVDRKLRDFEGDWAAKKSEVESTVLRHESWLGQLSKKGELPFEEKLIEAEKVIMTSSRAMVFEGGQYEYKDRHGSRVIKAINISDVDSMEFEFLAGRTGRVEYSLEDLNKLNIAESHYNESDLKLKEALTTRITYQDAATMLTKEQFIEHKDDIQWDYGTYGIYRNDNGDLEFNRVVGEDNVFYPDPNDPQLLDDVAGHYGKILADSNTTEIRIADQVMPIFFGDNWRDAISKYIKTAKPEDITGQAKKFFDQAFGNPSIKTMDDADTAISDLSDAKAEARVAMRNWMNENSYVNITDTVDAVNDVANNVEQSIMEKRTVFRMKEQNASEQAKLDKYRDHPNFKEMPAVMDQKFRDLGLILTYNYEVVMNGRYKIPAFSALFIKDPQGIGGRLYNNKDLLKSRYSAKYGGKIRDSELKSAWYVPSSTDLNELYEIME
jgi:hypothetical protein